MKNIKNNKISKLLSKKSIVLSTITTSLVSVPIAMSASLATGNETYLLNNMQFSSTDSAVEYIKRNSLKTENKVEGYDTTWTVTLNNKTTYKFDNTTDLRNKLNSDFIKKVQVKSDVDLSTIGNETGQIIGNHSNIDFNNQATKTVYQGYNDQIYNDEESAYKSYFDASATDVYYFNDLYFQSKEDLRTYLTSTYLPSNTTAENVIVIKASNGISSSPIDLSQPDASKKIEEFISNNSTKTLRYTNSKNNKTFDITKSNVNSVLNDVSLEDLDYIKMYSNEGTSNYIIDNKDGNNLIGPYFYSGNLDIGSFTNKKMWKKINQVDSKVYAESKIDLMIGSFFTSIINDDNVLNLEEIKDGKTPVLFRTILTAPNNAEKSLDEWFLEELGKLSPELRKQVTDANNSMMSGNKYNTFYKIPVLYSFLLQRIVSWNLGQNVLDLVIDYFTQICNLIQDAINVITMDDNVLLQHKSKTKYFDAVKFFQIGNNNYNLNTSASYFLNEIKQYPNLIATMSSYINGQNNLAIAAGLLPYSSLDHTYLFEYGIYEDEYDFYASDVQSRLELIYKVFSNVNFEEEINLYVNNSKNSAVKALAGKTVDEIKKGLAGIKGENSKVDYSTLIIGISSKNSSQFALNEALLRLEVKTYIETHAIIKDGYLGKIWSLTKSKDFLGSFVKYVVNNPDVKAYQVYLALVFDRRTDSNMIHQSDLSSKDAFAKALARLITGSLAAVSTTSVAINNAYTGYSSSLRSATPVGSGTWEVGAGEDTKAIPNLADNAVIKLYSKEIPDDVNIGGSTRLASNRTINFNKKPRYGFLTKFAEESGWLQYVQTNLEKELFSPAAQATVNSTPDDLWMKLADAEDMLKMQIDSIDGPTIPGNKPITSLDDVYQAASSVTGYGSSRNSQNGSVTTINPFDDARTQVSTEYRMTGDVVSVLDIDIVEDVGETIISAVDAATDVKTAEWSGNKKFTKIKNGISKATKYASTFFVTAVAALEIAFFLLELFNEEKTQDFYVYTTPDGTNFIWDGGLTVSKYLNLQVSQVDGIEKMELIKPIQISLPQVEEYYYYNGKKYYQSNLNQLKRDQLTYLLNSSSTNIASNFAINYSLIPSNGSNFVGKARTLEELIEEVIKDLNITRKNDGSFEYNSINKNSIYFGKAILSNGTASGGNTAQLANNIVDSIRKTWIVALPNLKNNISDGSLSMNTNTGSRKLMPGNYWDGSKVVNVDKTKFSTILVDNSANELKQNQTIQSGLISNNSYVNSDQNQAITNSKNALYNLYKSSFLINSRQILASNQTAKKFNNFNGDVTTQFLYEVNMNGKIARFVSQSHAMNYVLSNVKFTKKSSYTTYYSYMYNGMNFKNINEVYAWVNQNIQKIK